MPSVATILAHAALLAPAVVVKARCGDDLKAKIEASFGVVSPDVLQGKWHVQAQFNPRSAINECNTAEFDIKEDGTYTSTFRSGALIPNDNLGETVFTGNVETSPSEKFTFLQPYFGEARSGARSFVVAQGGSGDDAWAVIANDGGDYIESFNRVCIKEEGCFRYSERELASFCTPEFGYFIITRSMIVSETLVSNVSEMLETVGSSDDQLSLGFDARKLETVDQVGCDYKVTGFSEAVSAKFQPTSTASLRSAVLAYCSNPAQWDGSPIAEWDTSLVFSFERVFAGLRGDCGSPDLNKWATSQVTNMERAFEGARQLNLSIEKWDVSNVKFFQWMFSDATSFVCRLDDWNTESAVNFRGMFDSAKLFQTSSNDLSNWETSKVADFQRMFAQTGRFAAPQFIPENPRQWTASWDSSSATTTSFTDFAQGCPAGSISTGNPIFGSVSDRCVSASLKCNKKNRQALRKRARTLRAQLREQKDQLAELTGTLQEAFDTERFNGGFLCGTERETGLPYPEIPEFVSVAVQGNSCERYEVADQLTQDVEDIRKVTQQVQKIDFDQLNCRRPGQQGGGR